MKYGYVAVESILHDSPLVEQVGVGWLLMKCDDVYVSRTRDPAATRLAAALTTVERAFVLASRGQGGPDS